MRVEEIMKRDTECVEPQDSVQHAAQLMRDENIGFLPVCDPSMKVLGAVTDRDLAIRVLGDAHGPDTTVSDVLTREVIFCHPGDEVSKAQQLMQEHHKSRLICLDEDDHLIGVLSLSDIAQLDPQAGGKTLKGVSSRERRA